MSIETTLRTALAANGAMAALVADRIVADRAEQTDIRPFIVYTRTQTAGFDCIDGTNLGAEVAVEFQCWADTRIGADAVADACVPVLRGLGCKIDQRTNGYDEELDMEVTQLLVICWELS